MKERMIGKRIRKILKWITIVIFAVLIVAVAAIMICRAINASKYKIRTENGVQESTYVELGGIKQYIQIRGEDKENPIIIVLHGGPGSPMGYVSYYYQSGLESEYTFVNWDQRGCGRTYYKNPDLDLDTELSTDLLLEDLDELVDYLCEEYGQEKVIILGHSWGTQIGTEYCLKNPSKVEAYIGVSQMVNGKEGYINAALDAAGLAEEQGNTDDADTLREAAQNLEVSNSMATFNVDDFCTLQALNLEYHSYEGAISFYKEVRLGLTSNDMSWNDIRWFFICSDSNKIFHLERSLMQDCLFDFDLYKYGSSYEIPVYYIMGDSDWITPTNMVQEYYETVEAPDKELIVIEDAGHSTFMDNQEEFAKAVKKVLS